MIEGAGFRHVVDKDRHVRDARDVGTRRIAGGERRRRLAARGPRQAVRPAAGLDLAGHGHAPQVDHRNGVARIQGGINHSAIGRHQQALRGGWQRDALEFLAGGRVDHQQIVAAQIGDENVLAVRRDLQAVGGLRGRNGLHHFPAGDIHVGDGAVLRVGHPKFLAIGRQVEAFRSVAHRNVGDDPVRHAVARRSASAGTAWATGTARRRTASARPAGTARPAPRPRRALRDDADRRRADVGREDGLEIFRHGHHVGAVLARAHDPVDLLGGGVVAAHHLGAFGGEVQLTAGEVQAVGLAQSAQIDRRQGLLRDQVDPGDGVSAAIVGDVGDLAVVRYGDLVRIVAHGHARHDRQTRRVDDDQRVLRFFEDQQGIGRRARRR